jgi:hypothetical protein
MENIMNNKRISYLILILCGLISVSQSFGQGVAITPNTATSENLFVQFSETDPERIDVIKWNPDGLNGTEANLTNSGASGTAPCHNGDVEYFGNSWAPPDPPTGKVLVGAGTNGVRVKGPDSKVVISSVSSDCAPISAGISVNTIYKFWQGGDALNKMRVTRSFTFETEFNRDFRPFIPRFHPISSFSRVLHPNAAGTMLVSETVGGFGACPFGCVVTDWDGSNEATSWFAVHDPVAGRGVIVKRAPSAYASALWIDWDGASSTNSSSVLLRPPTGGFSGEVTEMETLFFSDATRWIPSLELPPGG